MRVLENGCQSCETHEKFMCQDPPPAAGSALCSSPTVAAAHLAGVHGGDGGADGIALALRLREDDGLAIAAVHGEQVLQDAHPRLRRHLTGQQPANHGRHHAWDWVPHNTMSTTGTQLDPETVACKLTAEPRNSRYSSKGTAMVTHIAVELGREYSARGSVSLLT